MTVSASSMPCAAPASRKRSRRSRSSSPATTPPMSTARCYPSTAACPRPSPSFRPSRAETESVSPMPTPERVREFIARVEAGDHVEAIQDFYHRDATMQENLGQKREGIEALVAGEKAALVRMGGAPESKCIRYAISGDTVMINWTFAMGGQFATPDGKPK